MKKLSGVMSYLWRYCIVFGVVFVSGCFRPDSMLVREGQAPGNVDKDVVFRTTYYFRVFNYCALKNRVIRQSPEERDLDKDTRFYTILNDSMYRFTMTGKANTLFSKINFESGSLMASEIDPLGSRVVYKDGNAQFQSVEEEQQELEDKIQETQSEEIIKQRNKVVENITQETLSLNKLKPEATASELNKNITEIHKQLNILNKKTLEINCPSGAPVQRGFQVLGPEGWRTFNQNERLIMVMSSDAEPLVSTLKELSQRVLSSHSSKQSEQSKQLEKIKETNRIMRAQYWLNSTPVLEGEDEELTDSEKTDLLVEKIIKIIESDS